jgi:hypothetical protein
MIQHSFSTLHLTAAAWMILVVTSISNAAVLQFTNQALWNAGMAGNYTAIGFTEYPGGTLITNQYSSLGVSFLQPPPFRNYLKTRESVDEACGQG